jgi:tyrosinase
MRSGSVAILLLQALSAVLALPQASEVAEASSDLESLAQQAYEQTKSDLESGDLEKRAGTCSWQNIRIRREWGSLSKKERKDYITAVQCLQSKPAKTPAEVAPGAKSRFDDWVATHINQTQTIHYTGNFLAWHRYYTWLYEEALRNECGYKGTQPVRDCLSRTTCFNIVFTDHGLCN